MTCLIDIDDPTLETVGFVLRVREGKEAEYLRRHDDIWPEMARALLDSGILHYEIWLHAPTRMLFAHQIRRRGQAATPEGEAVMARWRAHMADVLEMDGDRPFRDVLSRQFRLVAQAGANGSL
jgi:L-rhamnose mutarotase